MPEVRAIAVIGAGRVGRSVACAAVMGGYRTILEDILPASLRKAEAELRAGLSLKETTDGAAALDRLEYASTVEEAAREADLVIEAVPDELESKIEIFTLLDKICKPGAILVSTTAGLNISEIASVTYRVRQCVAMRFQEEASGANRVQIVRGSETSDETVAACEEMARRMGREVVL